MTALAAAAAGTAGAHAQPSAYPARPVRFVNPYAPGGAVDFIARLVAQRFTELWGQPFIVDNRPGAGTTLGTELVARATPDGYTLLFTSGTIAANVSIYPKLAFDVVKDLSPVAQVVQAPYILVLHPAQPARTVRELIEHARAHPGRLSYGSVGTGSSAHLTMELFRSLAGIDVVHVPYKGGAPSVTSVLAGETQALFSPVPSVLPHARAGRLRALAVSSARRVALAPDLPTVAEAGVAGFESIGWYAIFAPAGTPPAIVDRLNAAVARFVAQPEVGDRLLRSGMVPAHGTPRELGEFLGREIARWARVIRDAGVRPE